jgi:hypothetical protein
MICVLKNTVDDKESRIKTFIEVFELTEAEEKIAFEAFLLYKKNMVIIDSEFNDETWKLSEQYQKKSLSFKFDEIIYKKHAEKRGWCKYKKFVYILKVYILLQMGQYGLNTVVSFVNALRDILNDTEYFGKKFLMKKFISKKYLLTMIADFLSIVPMIEDIYDVIEDLKVLANLEKVKTKETRRELAEFQSMFLFDKMLDIFWKENLEDSLKKFYFPLYLWWKITMVLPLRVTEFLLTPKDCIKQINGEYVMTVRRSKKKGGNALHKKLCYKIEKDYRLYSYIVPEKFAKMIQEYQIISSKYKEPELDMILNADCYKRNNPSPWRNYIEGEELFKYRFLENLLVQFYKLVLEKKYGINKVTQQEVDLRYWNNSTNFFLNANEILMIKPGDTRHFAMINLVLNGCSPIIARDFAGHSSVLTSNHYYSNIDNYVKTSVYQLVSEIREKQNKENPITSYTYPVIPTTLLIDERKQYIKIDEGKCFSSNFALKSLSDCINIDFNCLNCIYCLREKSDEISRVEGKENQCSSHLKDLVDLYISTVNNSTRGNETLQNILLEMQRDTSELKYLGIKKEEMIMNGKVGKI